MHRLRTASTKQRATLTTCATYEGPVTTTSEPNSAPTCVSGGVRFRAYNGDVTTKTVLKSTTVDLSATAAEAVAR